MNLLEQQILDLIQDAFPLVERPYKALAEMLNCGGECAANLAVSEQDVFDAVEGLRSSGVIRRIGGVYDSKKLGFISRLCAGKVPVSSLDFSAEPHAQTSMEKFASVVNEVSAITHNYIRSHEYNVWFTVIALNEDEIQTIIDRLCVTTNLHDVHVMSATRKFKINTVMKGACAPVGCWQLAVDRDGDEREKADVIPATCAEHSRSKAGISSRDLSESDKSRIRTACEDIPHSLTPFKDWGVSCEELREDIASKRMRRFGAILRHQNAGFAFNAMVCFKLDSRRETRDERVKSVVSQAGSLLASNPHISHCYERPSFEGFPYNVYAMMHANSAELLSLYVADSVNDLNSLQSSPVDYVVLHSVRELKKTSFKFFI